MIQQYHISLISRLSGTRLLYAELGYNAINIANTIRYPDRDMDIDQTPP